MIYKQELYLIYNRVLFMQNDLNVFLDYTRVIFYKRWIINTINSFY